jgi:hypothetical protein
MRERDLLKSIVPNRATLMRVTDPLVLKIQQKLTFWEEILLRTIRGHSRVPAFS